ncbi:hypothetical protein GCM10022402_08290 [Salinactinospora qingdaonensis]|uniref:Uncharacterized protein n=1 Tax=Salinactinospora qingdaonensis TaxID=702744 RepID=A0ABP7F7L4_9ACTN
MDRGEDRPWTQTGEPPQATEIAQRSRYERTTNTPTATTPAIPESRPLRGRERDWARRGRGGRIAAAGERRAILGAQHHLATILVALYCA